MRENLCLGHLIDDFLLQRKPSNFSRVVLAKKIKAAEEIF